jgi:hypothetical protein
MKSKVDESNNNLPLDHLLSINCTFMLTDAAGASQPR